MIHADFYWINPNNVVSSFWFTKKLEGKTFNLLCATFSIGAHFKGIFLIDNQYISYLCQYLFHKLLLQICKKQAVGTWVRTQLKLNLITEYFKIITVMSMCPNSRPNTEVFFIIVKCTTSLIFRPIGFVTKSLLLCEYILIVFCGNSYKN